MSLARLRDQFHKPYRLGVWVTVQHGPYAPKYAAEIVGSHDDWVKVRDEDNRTRLVHHEDVTFPGVPA